MIIITKNNIYKWNYKRLLRNLLKVGVIAFFVISYLVLSNMDFQILAK